MHRNDRVAILCLLLGIVLLAVAALALRAEAATPCCGITAINTKTGVVTAKVLATGKTFQFKVDQLGPIDGAKLLNSLKVGQQIYADFKTHKVSVNGLAPCCNISRMGF